MKKSLIAAVALIALLGVSRAEIGVVETTGQFSVFNTNSVSTNTIYISGIGTGNPRWTNYNFGTFDLDQPSNVLRFENFYFENYAYNGGLTPSSGTNNNWLDGANTAFLTLYRNGTNFWSGNLTQSGNPSPNNRTWNIAGGTNLNLLAGATNGFNTLGFIIEWTYNSWTGGEPVLVTTTSTSLGGDDAFFQVVPEPSTYALLTLSAVALGGYVIRRRKRS